MRAASWRHAACWRSYIIHFLVVQAVDNGARLLRQRHRAARLPRHNRSAPTKEGISNRLVRWMVCIRKGLGAISY
jgi:hypothetical protein